jgi:hypothetical protein
MSADRIHRDRLRQTASNPRKENPVNQTVEQFITAELVPLVRAALTEGAEVRAGLQLLADRVETLTTELAEGEVSELRRLVGRAVRALEGAQLTQVGGGA